MLLPSLQLPSAWCALSHCGFTLPAPFQGGSWPRGLDVHVNGESNFYSICRYLGSHHHLWFWCTVCFIRGSSRESSQRRPTSERQNPAVAQATPQLWHLGTNEHSRPCCPIPGGEAHIISSNSRCSCTRWKNARGKLLFSAVLSSFSMLFQVLKNLSLRVQGKKFKYCCLRRRAQEQVYSPNALSVLPIVDTISPSALGLSDSPHVKSIWKDAACSYLILQIFQQWRAGLGWRA